MKRMKHGLNFEDEGARVKALLQYDILDTEEEEDFDDIVELTAQICDVPIAMINLIDENRQWTKAKTGIKDKEIPRNLSFCTHAILSDEMMIVKDALQDERFSTNPHVVGEPFIRFYAAVPLITPEGYKIGTLAIVDQTPKELSNAQLASLSILGKQAMTLLNLRFNIRQRKIAEAQLKQFNRELSDKVKEKTSEITNIFERVSDAFVALDKDGYIRYVNKKAEQVVSQSSEEILGKYIWEAFPEALGLEFHQLTEKAMKSQQPQTQRVYYLPYKRWFENRIYPSPSGMSIYFRDITDEKEAELASKESEELRKLIMASALDAVICIDTNSVICFWNPQAEKIFGWQEKEILGLSLSDTIIPEKYRKQHAKGLKHYLITGEGTVIGRVIEISAVNRKREEFPIELTVIPIKQDNKEIFCAFIRDITSRKKAEEKLIEEKNLSDSIINGLPGIFYLFDTNMNFLRWNKNFEIVSGYSAEEMRRMSPLQFFDEDDKGRVKNAILNAFEKGAANVEAPFMTKSGQKTPYYFTGKFVNFEGFPCLLGLGIDISERKKAEERYRNIFENSLQGIYQSTPEGKFITVNPAMAKIFGYNSPEELIDLISDIGTQLYANPEDRQHMKHLLELHGQINGLELRALKKNKEIIWVNINNRAIKDEQGSIIYLEGILKDVTEGKLAEEKLRHQFEELQKTNFELDRFVYSVSHDLRAPLASILGLINVAQLEKSSDSENKYWEMVRNSVSRLDGFIKDILDYSSNSRMEIRNDEIDFPKIMQEAQNNLSYLSGIERLKIATEVSGGLPFYSDETRIKIILNNLICNVIKFQDSTKESNYFKLSVTITTQQAHINVSDNGIGIEKMHLDKIFKMFYRASENSKGSGLGLYITKETVLKLGGTIEVQSEFGKGTRFDILIPNQNRVR